MEVSGRGLLAHLASGFREWGVSATLDYDPPPFSALGPSASLRYTQGVASANGADALLARRTVAGIEGDEGEPPDGALEANLGHGFSVLDGHAVGTPYLGFWLTDGGRDYRLGWRLRSAERGDRGLALDLEATRREREHGVTLLASSRWQRCCGMSSLDRTPD